MKRKFFYTIVAAFYAICLLGFFSFTSVTKNPVAKNNVQPVTENKATIENHTQPANNEAATAEDEAITVPDHTSDHSTFPLSAEKYRPTEEIAPRAIYGTASYYNNMFNGRQASNGEIFSQQKLTGASNFLPLNEWVKVTNLDNGKSVIVKITDRTHPRIQRVIDLSRSAAKQLNYVGAGLAKVKVVQLGKTKPTV